MPYKGKFFYSLLFQTAPLPRIARDFIRTRLKQASRVDVKGAERGKYFRLVAKLEADGVDVSALLIEKGLAVPYDGGTKVKNWCE